MNNTDRLKEIEEKIDLCLSVWNGSRDEDLSKSELDTAIKWALDLLRIAKEQQETIARLEESIKKLQLKLLDTIP